jgi:hypothetical protein
MDDVDDESLPPQKHLGNPRAAVAEMLIRGIRGPSRPAVDVGAKQ